MDDFTLGICSHHPYKLFSASHQSSRKYCRSFKFNMSQNYSQIPVWSKESVSRINHYKSMQLTAVTFHIFDIWLTFQFFTFDSSLVLVGVYGRLKYLHRIIRSSLYGFGEFQHHMIHYVSDQYWMFVFWMKSYFLLCRI